MLQVIILIVMGLMFLAGKMWEKYKSENVAAIFKATGLAVSVCALYLLIYHLDGVTVEYTKEERVKDEEKIKDYFGIRDVFVNENIQTGNDFEKYKIIVDEKPMDIYFINVGTDEEKIIKE